jgi:hypothetical protein
LTPRGCEVIPFGIRALLDLHPNQIVMQVDFENAFDNISRIIIFKELCDAKGPLASIVPFTRLFYGAHFSLYY